MEQFCKVVVEFLQSEYPASYTFKIERQWAPLDFRPDSFVRLSISMCPNYKLIISDYYMQYLYMLYRSGKFIEERQQYLWQKELIDLIEGS